MHCNYEDLLAYLRDKLPEKKRRQIESHLNGGCKLCADKLSILTKLQLWQETPNFLSPPKELTNQVRRLFTRKLGKKIGGKLREIAATLIYDSSMQPAVSTLRSIGAVDRQMLFKADKYDIDFRISPSSDGKTFLIVGQLLSVKTDDDTEDFTLVLKPQRGRTLRCPADDLGQFQFSEVPIGNYKVYLESDSVRINITSLNIS